MVEVAWVAFYDDRGQTQFIRSSEIRQVVFATSALGDEVMYLFVGQNGSQIEISDEDTGQRILDQLGIDLRWAKSPEDGDAS